jgi:hypothetical protein
MLSIKLLKITFILILSSIFLNSCGGKFPGADARKYPEDPAKRVAKNLEEGKGFRVMDLDTIDFMPLTSVNYSGGIIITDWYATDQASNESIKISIRFLTNEIRADSLDIKVFNKKCLAQYNCVISEKTGNIITELNGKILKIASIYKEENKKKKLKEK